MTRLFAILGAAVVLAVLVTGGWIASSTRSSDAFADCRTGRVAGIGKIGGPFSLIDQSGQMQSAADVIDGLTLIYFGYAYCPDLCPLDTTRNAEVASALKSRGIDLKPVFISIDPERDTPEILTDFVAGIDPGLVALTGSPEQIAAAAKSYGVYYAKNGAGEDYLMDHSVQSYLMHPDYGSLESFSREIRAGQVTDAIACFANKL